MRALAVYTDRSGGGLADVMSALHLGWEEAQIEQVLACELTPDSLVAMAPDLIVVAVSAPDYAWLTQVRRIRQQSPAIIAVVSTGYNEADLIEAVEAGADIFMGVPLSLASFVARVRALVRRAGGEHEPGCVAACGDLTIDPERHEARLHGQLLHLTPTEFQILLCLTQRGDRVTRNQFLCTGIWLEGRILDETTLRKHIQQLRRKFDAVPEASVSIVTIAGVGHKLVYKDTDKAEVTSVA
jgi:two-component system KDP operon response regulator KdpE